MSRLHELKTWPEPFEAVMEGRKRHEVRVNDRDFREGDGVVLRRWDPETQRYDGSAAHFAIGYVSRGPEWGIPEGMCVFSLVEVSW